MGSQLRWLERTPDKREVDGSIPFEPTILTQVSKKLALDVDCEKSAQNVCKGKKN